MVPLLGKENNQSHAHNTDFCYLKGISFKLFNDHPCQAPVNFISDFSYPVTKLAIEDTWNDIYNKKKLLEVFFVRVDPEIDFSPNPK